MLPSRSHPSPHPNMQRSTPMSDNPNPDLIEWGELPDAKGGIAGTKRTRFIELLKDRPGEWARYRPGHKHGASVAGQFKKIPGIEAASRSIGNGKYDIWVRWVGEEGSTP